SGEDIIATNVQLVAGNSIGILGNTIETDANFLAVVATNGSVYLFETDAVEVGTVNAIDLTRVTITNGTTALNGTQRLGVQADANIQIEVDTQDLVISQQIISNTAGDIVLLASD